MHPLEKYLHDVREIHSTGVAVPETSYYPVLRDLLNAIGSTLKPAVRCIMHPANQHGAGLPDGALFTIDQFQRGQNVPIPGQKPNRGVIEVKSLGDDSFITASSDQV